MPHIHEKIDFAADAFIVYKNKVLLRKHDKHKMWLSVGGHIELHEDPMEAVVREAKEEVGLDIEIFGELPDFENAAGEKELVAPRFLNRHPTTASGHEHISFIYFARSNTDEVRETEGEEKSGGLKWFTEEELDDPQYELLPKIRHYAKEALRALSS